MTKLIQISITLSINSNGPLLYFIASITFGLYRVLFLAIQGLAQVGFSSTMMSLVMTRFKQGVDLICEWHVRIEDEAKVTSRRAD